MTFPSRRNLGYRAELARAIFWALAWQRACGFIAPNAAALRAEARVKAHRVRARARLCAFTGGLLQ